MIPKIIHFCWLSGDEFPQEIQKCIDSWKKHLPDYEFWLWDRKRFNIDEVPWVKEAFENKKYAFAADYIRLYALYNYGGIYLDSDVLVYKSFDSILHLPYFIGEDYTGYFEPAIIGSEKQMPWIKELLNHYTNRHFIKENGSYDMTPLPVILHNTFKDSYKFYRTKGKSYSIIPNTLFVFPKNYFNSRDSVGAIKTKDSFCSHNYSGSWVNTSKSFKEMIKKKCPHSILRIIFHITNKLNKNKIGLYKIKYSKDI